MEAVVPADAVRQRNGWTGGLATSPWRFGERSSRICRRAPIAAAGGEVAFPTGDADRGLGNGYHVFEPFGMLGRPCRTTRFRCMGNRDPSDASQAGKEAYLRTAIGFTHMADRGFGCPVAPVRSAAGSPPLAATPSGMSCHSYR